MGSLYSDTDTDTRYIHLLTLFKEMNYKYDIFIIY